MARRARLAVWRERGPPDKAACRLLELLAQDRVRHTCRTVVLLRGRRDWGVVGGGCYPGGGLREHCLEFGLSFSESSTCPRGLNPGHEYGQHRGRAVLQEIVQHPIGRDERPMPLLYQPGYTLLARSPSKDGCRSVLG